MSLRSSGMIRDANKIVAVAGGSLVHSGSAQYQLNNNDRTFSKRVYTVSDQHTGDSKPYMRSSIDLSFDGGNYIGIQKDFEEKDIKAMLKTSEVKGKFQAPKD